mmetsp:Transcript_10668/g.16164  ORF Transcript_10668/g.16164 Transcript_10668/m.16164 type:complete len:520 (+) Transcript_10668:82-1641(+)
MQFVNSVIKKLLPQQTSHEDGAHINTVLQRMHKYHQRLTAIYLPLVVIVMIFSCFWAYIQGAFSKYTDPSSQWQACLVTPNSLIVPLTEMLNIAFGGIRTAVVDALTVTFTCPSSLPQCSNSTECVSTIQNQCFAPLIDLGSQLVPPEVPNVPIPVGQLLEALGYIGFQCVIFSMIAHGALNRALRHPSWLPATIALMVWCIFAILTYYTVNPIIPIPAKTNATTLLFMMYARKEVFDDINDGDNNCNKAYTYVWVYLSLILAIVVNISLSVILAIRAEWARLHAPNRKAFQPLQGTLPPLILCVLLVVFYVILCCSKITSSSVMLQAIHGYDKSQADAAEDQDKFWFDDSFFPFQKGTLDISSLLFVSTFMSVIRGYSRQSVSAFRLAAGMSFAFALTAYPGITGAYRFYDYNDFQNFDKCRDYFLDPDTTGTFGYPTENQAEAYCTSFRVSLASATGLIVCMHIMMVLAGSTYNDNQHRASAIFEPLDPVGTTVIRNSLVQSKHEDLEDDLAKNEDF